VRRDPRDLERHVRTFLVNERVPDLYRQGMTMGGAEDAVRRDPRDLERHVRTFLVNEHVPDLYRQGMTMEGAEDAAAKAGRH
jgi:hypothetical protein